MTREQAINYLFSCGFTHEQVGEVVRALTYEPARLSVDEVTALAEWTTKLTKASEDAYNKGYADGMKAQAEHEGLCKEEREISKEKAIEILRADSIASYSVEDILSARDMAIKALKQEPKTGEWIKQNDDYFDWYECSECGYGSEGEMQYSSEYDVRTNYCPHCGAEMVGPQADKEQNE